MPRVLLDLRMVRGPLHGIARYALELARRLPRLAPPGWSFQVLVPPEGLPGDLGPLRPELPEVRATAGFLSPLEQPSLAAGLWGRGLDLFHATSFSLPALWPGPLVATLHDANHLALPQNYGPGRTAYYRLVVGPRAKKARALITVSDFSREELSHHLGIPAARFQVVPQGVDDRFGPRPPSELAAFKRRLRLPARFLLAMGSLKPHKNLALVARIASRLPLPVALLAGAGAARRLGFPQSTVDLSHVHEDDLPLLYASAEGLLFPSSYEGFGLPPLEAMASGCPVIASRGSAVTEVCEGAALLLDPGSEDGWREETLRLCRDERLRADLRARGLERAARYGWDDCVRRTLAVYERAVRAA